MSTWVSGVSMVSMTSAGSGPLGFFFIGVGGLSSSLSLVLCGSGWGGSLRRCVRLISSKKAAMVWASLEEAPLPGSAGVEEGGALCGVVRGR